MKKLIGPILVLSTLNFVIAYFLSTLSSFELYHSYAGLFILEASLFLIIGGFLLSISFKNRFREKEERNGEKETHGKRILVLGILLFTLGMLIDLFL